RPGSQGADPGKRARSGEETCQTRQDFGRPGQCFSHGEGIMSGAAFWSGKRVLVTGGGGFIGSYVVENLIQKRGVRPEDVIVPRSGTTDLRQFENCQRAVKGCQVVIH